MAVKATSLAAPLCRRAPRRSGAATDEHVYGDGWDTVHEGYFSNRAAARPLVAAVCKTIATRRPDAVVDLGGGTGFVLQQILQTGISEKVRLINLDASPAQLAAINHHHIEQLHKSVEDFRRRDLRARGPVLFVMRSVLHYAGRDGLVPFLRRIRSQMRAGEIFIHQTVCFDSARDAAIANRVYAFTGAGKWLPTTRELRAALDAARLPSRRVARPAPPLPLTAEEVARRYRFDAATTKRVEVIFAGWARPELPYRIFVSVAC
jgi:SAM-dependent methyltransferase